MTDRRHASDREAGRCSDEIGIRAADLIPCVLSDALLIHAICATGKDQDRLSRIISLEDQRFYDLTKFASRAICGFLRGARGFGMFDDGVVMPERAEQILYFLSRWGK